jgi:hypothetical protein
MGFMASLTLNLRAFWGKENPRWDDDAQTNLCVHPSGNIFKNPLKELRTKMNS